MICLLFAIISHISADDLENTINFPKYTYDKSTKILTWDLTQGDSMVAVNWSVSPYHFGDPTSPNLNVFDRQGFLFTEDTVAIKSNLSIPFVSDSRYDYHYLHLYEYQAAVLAAYYGLNIIPSDYYFSECGPKYYRMIAPDITGVPIQIQTEDFPLFVVGINDQRCYGTQGGSERVCKTNCVNGDDIDLGTYGTGLLTFENTNYIPSEDALKKLIAKFGPVSVEVNVWEIFYGWKTVEGQLSFLKFRISNDQLQFSDQGSYAGQGGLRVAYIETFPEKAVAYNPCVSDTLPSGGCVCTKVNHPTGCSCPKDLTDIPKENCPCPVTVDEHDSDPRKDGICKCPEKGTDVYDADPRTQKGLACAAGVTQTNMSFIMVVLIAQILAVALW
ncbi:MAG: hypothetical protein EZS28_007094 [Streblomastix strix]|uniref:Uncharacterized protein n=1 Tax=Streblomastix strix TaxID=222440 RepID=A0A5J4WS72_9EUKA|nr:MAG: hypothetical protein EZS28_007094 [Streblomastix strix]